MRKIMLLLAAAAAAFSLTAAAAPSSGHGAMIARDHARRSCNGCYHIRMKYGAQFYEGFNADAIGNYLRSKDDASARDFWWHQTSSTCADHSSNCAQGYWTTASGYRVIAADCGSSGQTIELVANKAQTGDTWEYWTNLAGEHELESLHCTNYWAMLDSLNAYTVIGQGSGFYNSILLFGG